MDIEFDGESKVCATCCQVHIQEAGFVHQAAPKGAKCQPTPAIALIGDLLHQYPSGGTDLRCWGLPNPTPRPSGHTPLVATARGTRLR